MPYRWEREWWDREPEPDPEDFMETYCGADDIWVVKFRIKDDPHVCLWKMLVEYCYPMDKRTNEPFWEIYSETIEDFEKSLYSEKYSILKRGGHRDKELENLFKKDFHEFLQKNEDKYDESLESHFEAFEDYFAKLKKEGIIKEYLIERYYNEYFPLKIFERL
jgi:hypothetical protein